MEDKIIYEAYEDGREPTIITHRPGQAGYAEAFYMIHPDSDNYFYSRAKAVRVLRASVRQQIKDLQYALKRIH